MKISSEGTVQDYQSLRYLPLQLKIIRARKVHTPAPYTQVKNLDNFQCKLAFSSYMQLIFVMQGKCLSQLRLRSAYNQNLIKMPKMRLGNIGSRLIMSDEMVFLCTY